MKRKNMESFHLHDLHQRQYPVMHLNSKIWSENACKTVKTNKWVKHYSSSHEILLVGEGDFSFSLSLAFGFGCASNIFATSYDSYDHLCKTYKNARSNLTNLVAMGATIVHEVDARKMKDHHVLFWRKFDFIVYNFPHAGFFGKEHNPDVIKMHQELVHGFFSNARQLLRRDGQIHVTHKTDRPYSDWNLKDLALKNGLLLIESVPFDIKDYPLYANKRGHGSASDNSFNWKESCTFKFIHNYSCRSIGVLPQVKFTVKGEVRLLPRGAGCAGVLVDETHSRRVLFCGPLPNCIVDVDVAELLAIKFALLVFERSEYCHRKVSLVVESESDQAVSWIRSSFGNPRELLADLQEISMALGRIKNHVEFCCIYRECGDKNHNLAQKLAMDGMNANKTYEAWIPVNM